MHMFWGNWIIDVIIVLVLRRRIFLFDREPRFDWFIDVQVPSRELFSWGKLIKDSFKGITLLVVTIEELFDDVLISTCSHSHQCKNAMPEVFLIFFTVLDDLVIHVNFYARWILFLKKPLTFNYRYALGEGSINFMGEFLFQLRCGHHLEFFLRRLFDSITIGHDCMFPYQPVCEYLLVVFGAKSDYRISKRRYFADDLHFLLKLMIRLLVQLLKLFRRVIGSSSRQQLLGISLFIFAPGTFAILAIILIDRN